MRECPSLGRNYLVNQLKEILGHHRGYREEVERDPSKVTPEIPCIVAMGSQPTVHDRADAVYGKFTGVFCE